MIVFTIIKMLNDMFYAWCNNQCNFIQLHSLQLASEWMWLDLVSACQKKLCIVWLVSQQFQSCHHGNVDQGIVLVDYCGKRDKVTWTLGACYVAMVLVFKHK